MHRRPVVSTLLALTAAATVGCGTDGAAPTDNPLPATVAPVPASPGTTPGTTAPIVRQVLGQDVDPPGAPGRTLSLVRYTIAPGAQLPVHIHPGVQLASIESGTLTYTVESGTAKVRRSGSTADEAVTGPTTVELRAGDAVTETGEMVHYGANRGDVPLLILSTLLTVDGKDLAINVPAG